MKVAVLLAEGFETIEALTTVDIMRRAGVECSTFGTKGIEVTSSHSITIKADKILSEEINSYDVVVLPGGMPGAVNLRDDEKVNEVVESIEESTIHNQEVITSEVDEYIKEENIEVVEEPQKKVNLFERWKQGLTKAKQGITDKIDDVLKSYTKVDEELLEELEEILITADVGVNTTMDIIDKLRDKIKENKITEPSGVKAELKNIIEEI